MRFLLTEVRTAGVLARDAPGPLASMHSRRIPSHMAAIKKIVANAVRFLLTAVRTAGVLARDAPGPLTSTHSRRIPPHGRNVKNRGLAGEDARGPYIRLEGSS